MTERSKSYPNLVSEPQSTPSGTQEILTTLKPRFSRVAKVEIRFLAIWIALGTLVLIDAVFLPRSLQRSTLLAVSPFAAFLAITAIGQAIVIMARGIDLSVPAIMSLSCAILIGFSAGNDAYLFSAVGAAILAAVLVGAVNGVLIAFLRLNALIVTLAVGAIVTGVTIWYRQSVGAESPVPPSLAEFGNGRLLGIPTSVAIAFLVTCLAGLFLTKTVAGRRFEAVGTNPEAAHVIGMRVRIYQAGAYVTASMMYGIAAMLLAGFIRNPTLDVGAPYFMSPIAAAVLGGVAMSGGVGNMLSVAVASIFLIQLDQSLKMVGLPTSWQLVIQGVAIGTGMYLSELRSPHQGK
ncbi:ABC transporter permease [Mesorhizobium sp. Root102]|uniref:ABC transporter permease n=1 Tax=Mesorhizobium sp. Root102 TaxID=1736422 RepID=UPI0009E9B49B|nr:ABC transporter permease [Mesorhizobium sp. Root102]